MSLAPALPQFPSVPTTADNPAVFNEKAYPVVNAIANFPNEINDLVDWMNANIVGSVIQSVSGSEFLLSANNSSNYFRFTSDDTKTVTLPSLPAAQPGASWIINNFGAGALLFELGEDVELNGQVELSAGVVALIKKVSLFEYDLLVFGGSGGGGGMENPMTTAGDLIVGGSGGTPVRLALGGEGKSLFIVDGVPAWSDGPSLGSETFSVSPGSAYAYEGEPFVEVEGTLSYGAGGGTCPVDFPPFGDVDGSLSPGTFFEFTGVGMGLIENTGATTMKFFALVLIGSTGNENIKIEGAPGNFDELWTTDGTFVNPSFYGPSMWYWAVGDQTSIWENWVDIPPGGHQITLTRYADIS
jgi:hypothetical protein